MNWRNWTISKINKKKNNEQKWSGGEYKYACICIHKCIRNDIQSMKRRAFNKHSSLSEETLIIKTKFSIDFEERQSRLHNNRWRKWRKLKYGKLTKENWNHI